MRQGLTWEWQKKTNHNDAKEVVPSVAGENAPSKLNNHRQPIVRQMRLIQQLRTEVNPAPLAKIIITAASSRCICSSNQLEKAPAGKTTVIMLLQYGWGTSSSVVSVEHLHSTSEAEATDIPEYSKCAWSNSCELEVTQCQEKSSTAASSRRYGFWVQPEAKKHD